MPAEIFAGPHRVWLEPPDLVCAKLSGDVKPGHLRTSAEYQRAVAATTGRIFFLADLSDLGTIDVATRKDVGHLRTVPYQGLVIYGASFQARLLMKMLLSAIRLFSSELDGILIFAESEAEARRWIEARRATLDATAAQGTAPSRE
ncbi:Hypothetical protein CAP_0811 [Chondromyces apiculatus DSM 436]|uniref:STAS/SEC14 domain-containing protein n=1 Tax=Chondromyces apiculatus DSM 436 TaxID=1192034 RepID=A0A017SUJ2_9BACT|nr:Hypothetical protein CAP_0811 [Chondromyces apiculatus DSM 436]